MRLANAVITGKLVHAEIVPLVPEPHPHDQDSIRSPTLTALLNTLAATLPGYGSLRFELDADYNIDRGIIEKLDVGKIVRRDNMPPSPD